MAYQVIQSCGLADFHRLRSGQSPVRPEMLTDADWVDAASFREQHEHDAGGGLRHIRWRIVGVHCAACVWLLERLPRVQPGIHAARLDLSVSALDIVFHPDCLPSTQRAVVASLGYRLLPWQAAELPGLLQHERRNRILRLAVASASALGSMHLALTLAAGDLTGDLDGATRGWYAWAACIVALPGLTWAALPFWRGLLASIRLRKLTVDAIVAVVLAIAMVGGALHIVRGQGDLYVDAAAMFVALLLAARAVLESVREHVARGLHRLPGLFGDHARRQGSDGTWQVIPLEDLREGDLVRVAAGEVVPVDGLVEQADAALISTAVITGESRPQRIDVGTEVWAGSRCWSGTVQVRSAALGAQTRIGRLVSGARGLAPLAPSLTDRLLRWFVPAVVVMALAVGGYWLVRDPDRALDQVMAVLLVSCPCAISLAAPLAGAIALARGMRRGILVRDPDALLRCAEVTAIVFDKTGTLTQGRMEVVAWEEADGAASLMPWVLAAASRSSHPVAQALLAWGTDQGHLPVDAGMQVDERPGRGLVAVIPAGELRIGNAAHVGIADHAGHGDVTAQSGGFSTVCYATVAGRLVLRMACADAIQPGVSALIGSLGAQKKMAIASGDRCDVVQALAHELGIPGEDAHGGLQPEEKAQVVAGLRRHHVVAMVGDGVNDAAAMAAADVGIGLRGGIAACLDRCDAVITSGNVQDLRVLLAAGQGLRRTIRWCLTTSLAYHGLALTAVWLGVIGPIVCAIAMPLSSLSVLGLALATRGFSGSRGESEREARLRSALA